MDRQDAEQARALLRHKNWNVTRLDRGHFNERPGICSRRDTEAPRKRWTATRGSSPA
jgi:hypothetical protein